jgi:hypothetical protein
MTQASRALLATPLASILLFHTPAFSDESAIKELNLIPQKIEQAEFKQADKEVIKEAFDILEFDRNIKNTWAITSTIPLTAKMMFGNQSIEVKGHSGVVFYTSPEALKQNLVKIETLNMTLFNVDQTLISGKKTRGKKTGVVAFSIWGEDQKEAYLKYDPRNLTLTGEIPVNLNFPQVDELVPPKKSDEDFYVSPRIPARIRVEFKLSQSLEKMLTDKQQKFDINGRINVNFQGAALGDTQLRPIRSDLIIKRHLVDIAPLLRFEVARKLCLQPVKILSAANDANPTGVGLDFGLPGARTEWNKADITFQIREWKTAINNNLKVADTSTEEGQIRGLVQDDDCIEVFFVENFNPVDSHGGGATWSSGTASAQIISSDGNATGGIDFTHLAHELGHVLALGHPGTSSGLVAGNSGTLMCPSGWHRDNPAINSQGNKDNSNNPLLTFSIKLRSAGPNCTNNGDCGACPF